MKKWVPLFVGLSLATLMVAAVAWWGSAQVVEVQCDGALPKWMLEPQGYELGGCAVVYPSDEAPSDADWTLYCLGVCMGDIPYWKAPREER
jgi:hypothetical protein